jgi:ABC-2 type transport system ATP-binding protein
MKDLILSLRDEGKTVLMCSHRLDDVQDVCNRIAILHQGELKKLGPVGELLTVRDITQIQMKGLNGDARREIEEVIRRHGGELLSVDNPTTTLEDLFLKVVQESEEHPGRRFIPEPATPTAAAK